MYILKEVKNIASNRNSKFKTNQNAIGIVGKERNNHGFTNVGLGI